MRLTYLSSAGRERVLKAVLDAGHEVEAIVITPPQKWPKITPTLEVARERGIPTVEVTRQDLDSLVSILRGKTALSAGFAYILPPSVVDATKLVLNVHGTLLPHYAGARTLGWVIANGEGESGVTVHVVDKGVDTGPILLQRKFAIDALETCASLAEKTAQFEPQVVVDALRLIESGQAKLMPQDHSGVERWPDRTPENGHIDSSRPLAELVPQILASDPDNYPAFFEYKGRKVCVSVWEAEKSRSSR